MHRGMNNVVIGKKELFSFAERHSDQKVRDYTALGDGAVLMHILNKIFPLYAVHPAPPQTHSITQRTLHNWEVIYRLCAKLSIPLCLLNPSCIASNQEHRGFSALALLFFLFNLSKRPEYSADFAEDVPEELIQYLQSLDSFATLFIGEALDWSAIPEEIGEQIRALPVFHRSAEEERAAEEEAVKQLKKILFPASKRREHVDCSVEFSKKDRMIKPIDQERRKPQVAGASKQTASLNILGTKTFSMKPKYSSPSPTQDLQSVEKTDPLALRAAFDREKALLQQLALKTEECEKLRCREVELVEKLSCMPSQDEAKKAVLHMSTQRSPEMYRFLYEMERERTTALETKLRELCRERTERTTESAALSKLSDAQWKEELQGLLDDIRDPQTNAVIEAHSVANDLHQIIEAEISEGPEREKAERSLHCLWTAYSDLEKRLVRSVELAEEHAPESMALARTSTIDLLPVQHELKEMQQVVEAFYTLTCKREEQWRSLCAKLYQVEKASFSIAEAVEKRQLNCGIDVDEAARERRAKYVDIEQLTEKLLRVSSDSSTSAASSPSFHDWMTQFDEKFQKVLLHIESHA